MSKAYLAWTVKLKVGLGDHHVTVKYLGDSPFTIEDLDRRLAGLDRTLYMARVSFRCDKFNASTYVLALECVEANAYQVHERLASLREEDYPFWSPHITVALPTWRELATVPYSRSIVDLVESVGPLTLFVDKKPVKEWR